MQFFITVITALRPFIGFPLFHLKRKTPEVICTNKETVKSPFRHEPLCHRPRTKHSPSRKDCTARDWNQALLRWLVIICVWFVVSEGKNTAF
jgi:hypothetical protein